MLWQIEGRLCIAHDVIYLTGGSSALRPLQGVLREAFADVPLLESDLFGGMASQLAYSRV